MYVDTFNAVKVKYTRKRETFLVKTTWKEKEKQVLNSSILKLLELSEEMFDEGY